MPYGLEDRVFARIQKYSAHEIMKRKIIGGLSLSISLFAFLEFSLFLISETKKSGLLDYISLLKTDYQVVMGNLSVYILSLVDSVPFFAITLSTLSVLAILASIRYIAGTSRFGYEQKSLTA